MCSKHELQYFEKNHSRVGSGKSVLSRASFSKVWIALKVLKLPPFSSTVQILLRFHILEFCGGDPLRLFSWDDGRYVVNKYYELFIGRDTGKTEIPKD